MAFTKNYLNEMFRTVLVLSALLSTVSAVDCKGKSFHCVNSTHFMICVDLGGGVSQAIDDFLVACPPPTVCQGTNHFECEFPAPTTPSTTLNKIVTDITQPWEEVVTVSSTGNTTKEFSENYMNTERITTAEYSVTTETTADLTTATASELYVDNKLNIPEILPTLLAEIATPAIETTQTLNENLNITDNVPIEVTVDIKTAVIETVTETTAESKNLTEIGPAIVDEITKTAAVITTDTTVDLTTETSSQLYVNNKLNIPEIVPTLPAEIATPAIETTQTLNENLNITVYVPTDVTVEINTAVIETVTQTTAESQNFTETGPAVVDETTKTAAEITTDTTVDLTTATASELYMNNKLNIPEIVPTLPAEIATPAIETTQPLNENLNLTDYAPTEVTVDSTTAVIETVTQTTTESKNLTETGPAKVDEMTKTAAEITTENIIIIDTTAAETRYKPRQEPSAKEQLPQTIHENLNVTGTESKVVAIDITTPIIERVTQNTGTENVVVDEFTVTTTETTTNNIIITDPLGTELGYVESTATEQITLTTNDYFLELETVQSKTKPNNVTILPQKERTDILSKEQPKPQHQNPKQQNIEKPNSSTAVHITSNLHTKNASKTDGILQNILPAKTTTTLETIVETAIGNTGHLTTMPVDRVTDNLITAPQLNNTIQKLESVNVSEPSKPSTSFEGSLRSHSSIMGNKHSAAKEIENKVTQIPRIHDRVTPYNRVASRNRTEKVANSTDERVVGSNINSPTLPVIVTKDVTYDHDAKDNNLNTTTNKSLNLNNYTTVINAPTEITLISTTDTQNLAEATVLDGTWTDTIENGASTEQPTTIYEGSLTTDIIKNVVTEYIVVSTRQAVNLDIATDVVPTTVSDIPSMSPAFEYNTNNDAHLPVTENTISTVNNGASTNGLTSVESINMDTLTTEAATIPTTISNAQLITRFEDNMKIETILPVTENIASTVNNEGSTNILLTAQPVHTDTITTKALDTPTTVSNIHLTPQAFKENMKIEISLPVTENTVSTVNGVSTNGFMTAQAVNTDTITTETVGIPTAISNTQSMISTVEDIITTEAPFGNALATTTENIVLKENNGVDKNDPINAQASELNTISTDVIYMPTKVTKDQALGFIDVDEDSIPATENIVSSISNGDNTNGFMTSQSVNVDEVNAEAMYGTYTTISNVQPIRPNFEDAIATDTPLTDTGNIESYVNYGVGINNATTAQPVNEDEVNMEITHIPTTIINGPPKAHTIEDIMIDVPLPATGIYLSSVNNGASTTPAVNVDKIKTQATINNVPAIAPVFDSTRTESSLSATKNIVSAINNGVSTNDLTTLNAGLETVVQLTTETYTVPPSKVIEPSLNNEKTVETVHGDIITTESGTPLPDIIKGSPNNAIQKIQTIINSSANTAVESEVKENYDDNKMTTITNLIESLPVISLPSKNTPVTGLSVDKSTSHVSQIENINEQASVYNAASSRTEASPINDNITRAITSKSIPTNSSDSNKNLINPQAEGKTTQVNNSLQSRTTERIDHNIIWNPLANQVLNDLIQNPESIGTSVTNINAKGNDRDASSLNTEIISQQGSTGITGSPNYAHIDDTQSIDVITTQRSIGVTGSNDILTTNGQSASIAKVNNEHETDYRLNSQSKIAVTISLNQKTDKLATAGVDVSSVSMTEATGVGTPMEGNNVNKEQRADTLSKPVMLDVLPLPINNIQFNAPTANIPVAITDFVSNVIITESYTTSSTSRPSSVETKIQNSVNVGDVPTVPEIEGPAFNFQIGVSDKTSDTTTVPAVGSSTSNLDIAKTVVRKGDTTFNLETKSIDQANVLSQPSRVEKTVNKKTSAPNNAHVIPDTKTSGSGKSIVSENANTGIISPESVPNYNSQKSVYLTPQETTSSRLYQNSDSTVVTDLKSASQNISSNTKKAPQKSTGNDKMLSEVTHQNNCSTNITSSIAIQGQNISISTARPPPPMVTPNAISHVNNNLNKQVPTDAAQTFTCINGVRGRYSDKDDCRKFYFCIGNKYPIVGYCPETTVFSDLKKLCTKNMSHCIRENQFKCPSAGRFSDFTKDNVYYICINHNTKLYRFKFQCQKGYILDKTTVHCIETKEIESNESVSISSNDNSSKTSSSSISSSISSNSNSNNRSKHDNSSSNSDSSSKSKKSKEAVETSEKSEGDDDDDDDDEVFKCKKEGNFPIRNECRRYYLCKKNKKSEYRRKIKKCNSGKVFHKDKKKCVDDDSYEC